MRAADRGDGEEFQREVAVGDRIQRIAGRLAKAQRRRRHVSVDREARSGQRRRAQRAFVDAHQRVAAARQIARRHLHIGQAMVAEGDRLGDLQMGESRHHRVDVLLGLGQQRIDKAFERPGQRPERRLHMQAEIQCNLVVARAGRVQAPGSGADQFGEPRLDVHVDVLALSREIEVTVFDLRPNGVETARYGGLIIRRDDARGRQHRNMGFRPDDIFGIETFVEIDRRVDLFHDRVRTRRESAAPHLVALRR